MCTQPLRVSRWIDNSLVQKFTLQRPAMTLLFKNYSLIEVISADQIQQDKILSVKHNEY